MITDFLAKLDEHKRKRVIFLTMLGINCVCYLAITSSSLTDLQQAKINQIGLQQTFAATQKQIISLPTLHETLSRIEQQVDEQRQRYFDDKQASEFFEKINTMAIRHHLKPISLMGFESKNLTIEKDVEIEQEYLAIQSAKISVDGSYFNIINFLEEITNRPQKVSIKDLSIALVAGQALNPRASFNIIVLVDSSENNEK